MNEDYGELFAHERRGIGEMTLHEERRRMARMAEWLELADGP
jgi:hypothetical protein